MDSVFFMSLLPVLLAFLMMGLGLELTTTHFFRVLRKPKIIFITLFSQLVILTSLAFLICIVLELPPLLAVGLMLLAASPGGPTANIFSYLYKGDIALNISITAMSTLISIFTLPFILNLSLMYFLSEQTPVDLPAIKITQVFFITVIPVIIGMFIRARFPSLSITVNRPMRIFSIAFLIALFCFAIFKERYNLVEYFENIGIATILFCFSSLFVGYCVPILLGIRDEQARACTFEISIHNTAIAMTMAISVLGSTMIAVPAGIYTIVMYTFATLFGFIISRQPRVINTTKSGLQDS
ncbi:bile acid:sodium symporter [Acinetobacter sp. NCu2D-2]|uniref:bile acid:sodium symporter family protein n=1 Tax=Acinetobacter sp. NCu2D-2 TaxID=1608473 RepID=UPI0007CDAB6B|nr:bile acid:sodium symporter family protein [Acinetobacter sp. NCu2D-2]ANF81641.1 bile acid:sodium symporter [Acinetobacter sp. NCu2D-2]